MCCIDHEKSITLYTFPEHPSAAVLLYLLNPAAMYSVGTYYCQDELFKGKKEKKKKNDNAMVK